MPTAETLIDQLRAAGVGRGDLIAVAVSAAGFGLCVSGGHEFRSGPAPAGGQVADLELVEQALRPRWVWWDNSTATALIQAGVRPATCFDLAAVHRLIDGGWAADPARVWAGCADLDPDRLPALGQLDLLGGELDDGVDLEQPTRPDGYLRPEWAAGGWGRTTGRLSVWAALALRVHDRQRARLGDLHPRGDALATAHSESAAELLCAELAVVGLPLDADRIERILADYIGPRPSDAEHASRIRDARDEQVKRLVPGHDVDLRSPAQVRELLARIGIEVSDTRSWRLEMFRGAHPVVEALLAWRKSERLATTYGYRWLDEHTADGRLRGTWTGCDGGAGRMTASAGLHSMPAELRPAVQAPDGQLLVRADLGQIEPRVLAEIAGDPAFALATHADDLYAPVAERLNVDRPTAKIAVLAAMYGQTSGTAGAALQGLEDAYPIAMRFLKNAYESGRTGRDLRTHGGRLIRMYRLPGGTDAETERRAAAGRGRFARNAVVQGAAAEFFKAWAATVRARCRPMDGQIVMCLHDELLVQAPEGQVEQVAAAVGDALREVAARWAPSTAVRFVADLSIVTTWSDAKPAVVTDALPF
ncbi:MAG: polymerase [Frankiales bacterium]|nr:polymerase [Frankiales bacterium]